MLRRLREQLAARRARLAELLNVNDRDLNTEELREFDTLTAATGDESIAGLEARIGEVQAAEERAARAQAALAATGGTHTEGEPAQRASEPRVRITHEPTTYQRGGQQSYFRDLVSISLNRAGAAAAAERMERSTRETHTLMQERALTTIDGAGGDFVPPLWMVEQYVELARAGRVTADLVRQETLPTGTDSINLPKLATGTATAEQATQNTAVQNTDATTATVTANVATLAGQQVVAVQLIEQSPINMDTILLADLAADYAVRLDVFVINNNAANKRGLLNVTGINAVSYTDATPTVAELYPKVADGIQQIDSNRFMPATVIVMHPRRWAWFTAAVDTQGRPFVVPDSQAPMNSAAQAGPNAAQGYVGKLQGLPVYKDPNIPINLGAGTNEDRVIIFRADDVILFEGSARAEAFRETKADQLSVLLRFYNYVALHSERFPKSISVISGTGLITPTF